MIPEPARDGARLDCAELEISTALSLGLSSHSRPLSSTGSPSPDIKTPLNFGMTLSPNRGSPLQRVASDIASKAEALFLAGRV
jgi:hypothetical protein